MKNMKLALGEFRNIRTISSSRFFDSVATEYVTQLNTLQENKQYYVSLRDMIREHHPYEMGWEVNRFLDQLWTYQSLQLRPECSLKLDDIIKLGNRGEAVSAGSFDEQLTARNHLRAVRYCRHYCNRIAKQLHYFSKYGEDDYELERLLKGVYELPYTFVATMSSGHAFGYSSECGSYFPSGEFYFYDKLEEHEYLDKGINRLVQLITQGYDDVIMSAAKIHSEFANAHHYDATDRFLYSLLYLNFSLLVAGHVPVIIPNDQLDNYRQAVKAQYGRQDSMPMAVLLATCLNDTYAKWVLPELEKSASELELCDSTLRSKL